MNKLSQINHNKYNLNTRQEEAANYFDGPLLVLAGAGTGKTKTITSKIAIILENNLAYPWQILAVTFTNKAAREMKERIETIIDSNANDLTIGTFHSVCIRMLRKYAGLVGLTDNFTILDEQDQQKVIKTILEERRIDTKAYTPRNILSVISRCKNKFLKPSEFNNENGLVNEFFNAINLLSLWDEYQIRLKNMNALDFDDIIALCIEALEKSAEMREYYQNRYRFVLIDEYQDINGMQYRWVKLVLGENPNICCVGDDDQSIYGWRGAEVQNILNFRKDFSNAKIIRLEQNYRSTTSILKVADALISNNSDRLTKTLWTDQVADSPVNVTFYKDSKEEAAETVRMIDDLTNIRLSKTYGFKDIAILVRSSAQTRLFEEALVANAIPYKIVGGLRFYERKEIKDIIAYLRVLISDNDILAFERVLSYPKKGLGDKTLADIFNHAANNKYSVLQALRSIVGEDTSPPQDLFGFTHAIKSKKTSDNILGGRQESAVRRLVSKIFEWREMLKCDIPIGDIVKKILLDVSYEDAVRKDHPEDFETRLDNINELIYSLESFGNLVEFLEYTSLVVDAETQGSSDEVNIMTLHASKGLEFPVVFLPCWDDGSFPNQRVIDESGDAGVEEERRLGYVGITRACRRLFISHAKVRFLYGNIQTSLKSRFINEILESSQKYITLSDRTVNNFYNLPQNTPKISNNKGFESGDLVSHDKYGIGKVVKKENLFITVEFLHNFEIKTIRVDFLKKVGN